MSGQLQGQHGVQVEKNIVCHDVKAGREEHAHMRWKLEADEAKTPWVPGLPTRKHHDMDQERPSKILKVCKTDINTEEDAECSTGNKATTAALPRVLYAERSAPAGRIYAKVMFDGANTFPDCHAAIVLVRPRAMCSSTTHALLW